MRTRLLITLCLVTAVLNLGPTDADADAENLVMDATTAPVVLADLSARVSIGKVHPRGHLRPGIKHSGVRKPYSRSQKSGKYKTFKPHRAAKNPSYRRVPFFYGYVFRDRDRYRRDDRRAATVDTAPPPEPVWPPAEVVTADVGPIDASGPGTRQLARGQSHSSLSAGDLLPAGTAYVLVQWRSYDLPKPPEGQVYARLRRGLYLIDPVERVIIAEVDPATAAN